jgi:hypothetical protein
MSQATELIARQMAAGSANARVWADILYNVKLYGAKGDGVQDDTVSVQATIDAAIAAGGKAVFFPHGTYKVTALTNLSSVVLFGDNASFVGISTTINQLGSSTSNLVFNVKDYGAKGDGVTNDTSAFVAAFAAIGAGNFGVVYVPPGRYVCDPITIPKFVTLQGASKWLWGNVGMPSVNYPPIYGTDIPANQSLLLITNTANPAITVNIGSTVEGLSFFYPNQVAPTAASPTVYPPTIQGNYGAVDVTIRNIMFYNSYRGIDLDGCDRHRIEWVFGDTLLRGIKINRCHDSSTISHVHFHDFMYAYSSNMGIWKLANAIGIEIQRSDAQQLNNIFVWRRNIGIAFTFDSSGGLEGGSFGTANDISFDSCTYSMQFYQTQLQAGWEFNNCQFSGSQILVQTANLVKVGLNNCRFWATGAYKAVELSNSNSSSVVKLSNCQISNGYTIAPIKAVAGATCRLYMYNVIFENSGIPVVDLVNTLTEFEFIGGSIGNNTITVPSMTGKRMIANVLNYNPVGILTTPTLAASGSPTISTFNHRVMVYILGGTVTGIVKNASNIAGMTNGMMILDPGESITITYSVAPTLTWFGL